MAYSNIVNLNYDQDVVSSKGNYFIEIHRQRTTTFAGILLHNTKYTTSDVEKMKTKKVAVR